MELLAQFLLRLAFGLAVGLAITSSRQVASGFFRNHLYVTLGLATLAALIVSPFDTHALWFSSSAAILSFLGAALWLYEARVAGKVSLWLVALCGFAAALLLQHHQQPGTHLGHEGAIAASGLLLGLVFSAMLLGHWYLNAPGMSLEPLRKLLALAAISVLVRAVISATDPAELSSAWWLFVVLRWSFGIFGVLGLLWMAWRTLEIPNTQSATGILYVAVIGVFVGELAAALLSAEGAFPL